MQALNRYIDHTLLRANATPEQIISLCAEGVEFNFYAVCVNSAYARLAVNELKNNEVKVAATVGFPLGAMSQAAKVEEATWCVEQGVDEIDMVINIGLLKAGNYDAVREEIAAVKAVMGNRVLKTIIETCYLTDEEKRKACSIAQIAGADFVKTSTGFGTGGATLEDVELMREAVGDTMKIKASGGIKTKKQARSYILAGANRIGTSSGIAIVQSN